MTAPDLQRAVTLATHVHNSTALYIFELDGHLCLCIAITRFIGSNFLKCNLILVKCATIFLVI